MERLTSGYSSKWGGEKREIHTRQMLIYSLGSFPPLQTKGLPGPRFCQPVPLPA